MTPTERPVAGQRARTRVRPRTLFLIGVTAGVVACMLPRLGPLMTVNEVDIAELFRLQVIIGAVVLSLIIGISMVWLFKGTEETTRNLFMSALALPAVLSGAINTHEVASRGAEKREEVETEAREVREGLKNDLDREKGENERLIEGLKRTNNIKTMKIDAKRLRKAPLGRSGGAYLLDRPDSSRIAASEPDGVASVLSGIFLVSRAHAAEHCHGQVGPFAQCQQFERPPEKQYMVQVLEAKTREEAERKQRELHEKNPGKSAPNFSVYQMGDRFLLLQDEAKSEGDALLEAIRFREEYGVNPVLIELDEGQR